MAKFKDFPIKFKNLYFYQQLKSEDFPTKISENPIISRRLRGLWLPCPPGHDTPGSEVKHMT